MILPEALKTYFEADQSNDAVALVDTFSKTAVVKDEGATHTGLEEIRRWWLDAKQKYQHTAQPMRMQADGETVSVWAMVSGNFPNSPAELHFRFIIEAGKICELEIG
jgi:SnoaL-like domain